VSSRMRSTSFWASPQTARSSTRRVPLATAVVGMALCTVPASMAPKVMLRAALVSTRRDSAAGRSVTTRPIA